MNEVNIAIVIRSRDVCEYYMNLLSEPDYHVIGCYSNGYDAILEAFIQKPEILIVDENIDGRRTGVSFSKAILKRLPDRKILLYTEAVDHLTILPASKVGIVDYLLKSDTPETILNAVKLAQRLHHPGQQNISERFYTRNIQEGARDSLMYTLTVVSQLTPKEIQITKQLADGRNYSEIAVSRHTTLPDIEEQAGRILEKFNKKDPDELVKMLRILNIMDFFDHIF